MRETSDVPVRNAWRFLRWLMLPAYAGHAVIVWLAILRPPIVYGGIEIDASWKQLVGLDLRDRIQAGIDFVFTYGPLGYLVASYPVYMPEVYWARVVGDMVLKAAVLACVLAPVFGMVRLWHRLVYLAVVMVMAPLADDAFLLLAITAGTGCLVKARAGFGWVVPFVAFVAVLGLGKFVYVMLGFGCVALLTASVGRERGLRPALVVPFAWMASLVIAWIAVGQPLANLPAFVKGSMEIASGYNESMRWAPGGNVRNYERDVHLALASMAITALVVWLRGSRPRTLRFWLMAAAWGAALFMAWKSAFVRQDDGHVLIYFCCAAIVPLLPWTLSVRESRPIQFADGLVLLAVAIAFVGVHRVDPANRPDAMLTRLRHQAEAHWKTVADPAGQREQLEVSARQLAERHQLPEVRRAVGSAPVDEMPHGQNILFMNQLVVRHRPVFQSYSAYTPYLQRINADFYADPDRGPSFVLFELETIDNQFGTVADSQVYFTLLRDFRPRLFEGDHMLLERAASRSAAERRQVVQAQARLNEWVQLPPDPDVGELAIDVDFSLLGSAWSFGFRGPDLYLDVRLDTDEEVLNGVVSRGLVKLPFLLDPLVRNTRDFGKLWVGAGSLPRVTSFRLRPRDGQAVLYRSEFDYTLWRSELPTSLDEATARSLRIDFPMFDRAPRSVAPRRNFREARLDGTLVEFVDATTAMTFADFPERVVGTGAFGMFPESWEGPADTDGVTFRIERVAGGSSTVLFERRLDPKRNERDRGMQMFAFEAELGPADTVVFHTLSGPDNRWDWSYWTDLRFADAAISSPCTLSADRTELDWSTGGALRFALAAGPRFANRPYRILGTTAGTSPGQSIAGIHVPLAPSAYFDVTSRDLPESTVFQGFRGTLDAAGRAQATLQLPPSPSPGVLHHVLQVLDDEGRGLVVSDPVPLVLR